MPGEAFKAGGDLFGAALQDRHNRKLLYSQNQARAEATGLERERLAEEKRRYEAELVEAQERRARRAEMIERLLAQYNRKKVKPFNIPPQGMGGGGIGSY